MTRPKPPRARRTIAAVLLLLLMPAPASPSATAPPERIDAATFLERIRRARGLAQQGAADPGAVTPAAVRAVLGFPVVIVVGDRAIPIPRDPVLEGLGDDADLQVVAAHLAAVETALSQTFASPPVDRDRIDAAVRDAYRGLTQAEPGLRERLGRRILGWLSALPKLLFTPSRGAGFVIAWLVLLALVAGLVFLLIVRGRFLGLVPESRRAPPGHDPERDIDWQAAADAAAGRGDFAEAVRSGFRALLATLAAKGVIGDDPGLTAGECRQSVAGRRPDLYPSVAGASVVFERVAYGRVEAGADDARAVLEAERLVRVG